MEEMRLANLTFSFQNSSRDSFTSPEDGFSLGSATRISPENPNKRIIFDENNLQTLFKQARSYDQINQQWEEVYASDAELKTNNLPQSPRMHQNNQSLGVYDKELTKPVRKVSFEIDRVYGDDMFERPALSHDYDTALRNYETETFVSQVPTTNAKGRTSSLEKLTLNSYDADSETKTSKEWFSRRRPVGETIQNNTKPLSNWVPKSKAAKDIMEKNEVNNSSFSRIGVGGVMNKRESSMEVDHSDHNRLQGDKHLIQNGGRYSFHGSYNNLNEDIETNGFKYEPIQKNVESDKWSPLNSLTNEPRILLNRNSFIENLKSDMERVINISNTGTDNFVSFDVEKEKNKLKLINSNSQWYEATTDVHSPDMTQQRKIIAFHENSANENSPHEFNHPQLNKSSVSLPIEKKMKNLKFLKNSINVSTEEYGNAEKHQRSKEVQKQLQFRNSKFSLLTVRNNMSAVESDLNFQNSIKRMSSIEHNSAVFDDGYGSGSNRTNLSSASETPSSDMIMSFTEEVNFNSRDINNNTARNGMSQVYTRNSKSLSNLHELLNEESEKEILKKENNEDEKQERNNIHVKLENILKQKAKTLERSKNPQQRKAQYMYPDPILTEKTKSLPDGLDSHNYSYIDSNGNDRDDIDASSHSRAINADSSYRHGLTSERSSYVPTHLLQDSQENSIHLKRKQSLLNELVNTIQSKSPVPVGDNDIIRYSNYNNATFQNADDAYRNQSLLGPKDHISWDKSDDAINLFDMFPLQLSPTRRIRADSVDSLNEILTENTTNQFSPVQIDQRPINKGEVKATMKTHLKDRTELESPQKETEFQSSRVKSFSFTSLDVELDDNQIESNHDVIMDDLESNQRKLSLENVEVEKDIFSSASFNKNKLGSSTIKVSDAHQLSLTESELADIRAFPHTLTESKNKGDTETDNKIDIENNNNMKSSKAPLHLITSVKIENESNVKSVHPVMTKNTKQFKQQPTLVHPPVDQTRDDKGKIETDIKEEVYVDTIVRRQLKQQQQDDQQQQQKKENEQERENNEQERENNKQERENNEQQLKNNEQNRQKQQQQQQTSNLITQHYLPEENEERVIKPSEYQVHRFSERKKYQAPQPPKQSRTLLSVKLDTSHPQHIPSSNAPIHGKRRSPKKTEPKKTDDYTITRHKESKPLNDQQLEVMEIDIPDTAPISNAEKVSPTLPTTAPAHWSHAPIASPSGQTAPHEKWSSATYTHTNVGRVNIPSNFLPNDPSDFNSQSTRSSTPSESPRSDTPKKTRRLSFTSNKSEPARSSTSSKIGNKLKMFFSPRSKRRLQKQNSNETLSTGLFSPRSDDDITRRKNMNNASWSYDDGSSISAGDANNDDDDSIDVDFISNDEWLTTQNNVNDWNDERNQNSARSKSNAPKIKAPLLPAYKNSKAKLKKSNYGIGKVIVPDVFADSHSNNITPLTFNTKYTRPYPEKVEQNNTVIDIPTHDTAFNSLDIRSIGYKAGRRIKGNYQPVNQNRPVSQNRRSKRINDVH